jgi:glucokinase
MRSDSKKSRIAPLKVSERADLLPCSSSFPYASVPRTLHSSEIGVYHDIDTIEDPVFERSSGHILVFDVGGSHVAAGASRIHEMTVAIPQSASVSKDGSLSDFLEIVASLGARALPPATTLDGVSVAMPNPFDCTRGISYMRHKYECLYGIDLRSKISRVLGCPADKIEFLNDAAAFLMGEIREGAARGANRVVGITLGTGVGSAFAAEGEIVADGPGVPAGGEIWNLSYKDGIVEKFVSASAIQEQFKARTGALEEVQAIASQSKSNPQAKETFDQFGWELGKVLRLTCAEFRPQRIILGGGIARSASLILPSAGQELAGLGIELCVSQLGERAALIGAAVDWMNKHEQVSWQRGSTNITGDR